MGTPLAASAGSPWRRPSPRRCCSPGPPPALADDDDGPTQGPITLTPEQATFVCTKRIPAILARVDRVTTRIKADASTRGSTAWLQAREDKARAAGRTEAADRIQERIDRRPERLDRLADAKKRATEVPRRELRLVSGRLCGVVVAAALSVVVVGGRHGWRRGRVVAAGPRRRPGTGGRGLRRGLRARRAARPVPGPAPGGCRRCGPRAGARAGHAHGRHDPRRARARGRGVLHRRVPLDDHGVTPVDPTELSEPSEPGQARSRSPLGVTRNPASVSTSASAEPSEPTPSARSTASDPSQPS